MSIRLRTPILCLCIIICIIIHHKQHNRLKNHNSKIFEYFTYIALIFTFSIGLMEYTVVNRDYIKNSNIINSILDNIVYISMILQSYLYTLFIMNFIEISKRKFQNKNKMFLKISALIAMLLIIFFPTKYLETPFGPCTYGEKAYITFAILLIHLIFNVYYLLFFKNDMSKNNYNNFFKTLIIYIVTYAIQAMYPGITISHMSFVLEILILYLDFENTEKYIDDKTELFNKKAFYKILEEKIFFKNKDKIILYIFDTSNSNYSIDEIIVDFSNYLIKKKIDGYKLNENVIAVFTKESNDFCLNYKKDNVIISKKTISLTGLKQKELDNFININCNTKLYFDKMTKVFNRNKYEIDIKSFKNKDNIDKKYWYVIIDINNLKETNDNFGHIEGDKLIVDIANIIRKVFYYNSSIYRIGGDEFAIITTIDDIKNNIEKMKEECLKINSIIPYSFSVGYEKYDVNNDIFENIVKKADLLMYEDKKQYKQRKNAKN